MYSSIRVLIILVLGLSFLSNFFLYLYGDNELKKEEEEAIYKEYDENIIDYGEFRERLDKAGRILIISNLNRDCKEIFEMYKSRDVVEKHFDIAKNKQRLIFYI